MTEFVAGTGGNWSHVPDNFPNSNVVKDDFANFGVLQFTLKATSANFAFDKVGGGTSDSGTINCQQPTGGSVPTVTGVSPNTGPTTGGNLGHHHRDQLHRVERREVRLGLGHHGAGQLGHFHHRHRTGGVSGHRGCHGDHCVGHVAHELGGPVHLRNAVGDHLQRRASTSKSGVGLTTLAVTPQTLGGCAGRSSPR